MIEKTGSEVGVDRRLVDLASDSVRVKALAALNELQVPLARQLEWRPGELQRLTPSIEALVTPDIDASLDEEGAKRAFWSAFRVLGAWYADLPPY